MNDATMGGGRLRGDDIFETAIRGMEMRLAQLRRDLHSLCVVAPGDADRRRLPRVGIERALDGFELVEQPPRLRVGEPLMRERLDQSGAPIMPQQSPTS